MERVKEEEVKEGVASIALLPNGSISGHFIQLRHSICYGLHGTGTCFSLSLSQFLCVRFVCIYLDVGAYVCIQHCSEQLLYPVLFFRSMKFGVIIMHVQHVVLVNGFVTSSGFLDSNYQFSVLCLLFYHMVCQLHVRYYLIMWFWQCELLLYVCIFS